MAKKPILVELHYFPCIEYVSQIYHSKEIIIERHEHFLKQSYRNRCKIRGANRIEDLIVPVKHTGSRTITDIKIDYQQKWLGIHKRAIMSAYGKSPYYEYFGEEILSILNKKHKWLFELNLELLTLCLDLLRIEYSINFTDHFDKVPKNDQIDIRGMIHPKNSKSQTTNFQSVSYPQVFGNNFVDNLSVLDLMFCEGANATTILAGSKNV